MDDYYNRRKDGDVVIFDIVPAPYPGSGLSNFGLWGGVLIILISIPLFIILIGFIFLALGIFVVWTQLKNNKAIAKENADRKPFSVSVSSSEISTKDSKILISDLRELQVGHAASGPSATQFVDVSSTAAMVGHNARMKVEAAQHHVSFQVLARMTGDSRPRLVAAGLTEQTARSLVDDLRTEVSERRASASSN